MSDPQTGQISVTDDGHDVEEGQLPDTSEVAVEEYDEDEEDEETDDDDDVSHAIRDLTQLE